MKFRIEKTKSFWMYIVGGFLSIAIGIILLPAWANSGLFFSGWGDWSVNIMISALLLAYILLYLVKRIKRYGNTPAQIVAIVELVLMAVIAVVCAVTDFLDYTISFGGPCQIFGIALWVRGASGVYTGYYCDSNIVKEAEEKKKDKKKGQSSKKTSKKEEIDTEKEPKGRVDDFTVWRLTLAIILISLGTYLFVRPAFERIHLQWVFSCAIIVVGMFFVVFGVALKPKNVKVDKNSPLTKSTQLTVSNDSGKITDTSATAMTKTSAYDSIKDE